MYKETNQKLESGETIFEYVHPNGEIEYCVQQIDSIGRILYKRLPKHVFDTVGGAEVVSDVSLVLDADLRYPSMAEQLLRFERGGAIIEGIYDDDENFDLIDIEDEPISEYELRTQEAYSRLNELRQKYKDQDVDRRKQFIEDEKRIERENLEQKFDEKPVKSQVETQAALSPCAVS